MAEPSISAAPPSVRDILHELTYNEVGYICPAMSAERMARINAMIRAKFGAHYSDDFWASIAEHPAGSIAAEWIAIVGEILMLGMFANFRDSLLDPRGIDLTEPLLAFLENFVGRELFHIRYETNPILPIMENMPSLSEAANTERALCLVAMIMKNIPEDTYALCRTNKRDQWYPRMINCVCWKRFGEASRIRGARSLTNAQYSRAMRFAARCRANDKRYRKWASALGLLPADAATVYEILYHNFMYKNNETISAIVNREEFCMTDMFRDVARCFGAGTEICNNLLVRPDENAEDIYAPPRALYELVQILLSFTAVNGDAGHLHALDTLTERDDLPNCVIARLFAMAVATTIDLHNDVHRSAILRFMERRATTSRARVQLRKRIPFHGEILQMIPE